MTVPVPFQATDVVDVDGVGEPGESGDTVCRLNQTCQNLPPIYTVSQKKLCHFYFYCNFGKCLSIFKILSMSESERNGS